MATDTDSSPLLRFHGGGPDDRGRTLAEILAHDDAWLEATHDYVQWVFPLTEPSAFEPDAPVLGPTEIAAFLNRPRLRAGLRAALDRMLRFYGLERTEGERGPTVAPGAAWRERGAAWLRPGDHNLRRLTRILTSLRLLGLGPEAQALFRCLAQLHAAEPERAGDETYGYWRRAADDDLA